MDTWRQPWASALPSMIKAVFVQAGSDAPEEKYGEQVHNKLLMYFGLNKSDVPILEYNASSAHTPFRPFRRTAGGGLMAP